MASLSFSPQYAHANVNSPREKAEHHSMVGSTKDPKDGKAVAVSVFSAVVVYAVFLVFCGMQAFLHVRQSKKGAISLR